jgi:hypothetical protein
MTTLFTTVPTFDWLLWDKNIYYSFYSDGPGSVFDCMNECVNIQPGVCHFFAFENGICYLGRFDITNGTVANKPSNTTLYSVSSKYFTYLFHSIGANTNI